MTVHRGVTAQDVQALVSELARRGSATGVDERLASLGIRRITVGRLAADDAAAGSAGIEAARRVYGTAVTSAETL